MPVDNQGTTAFDTFPKAYFAPNRTSVLTTSGSGTIHFPVESSRIEGGQRDHLHKYPHSPGASPEKLGRESYLYHVTSKFDTGFNDGAYPGLYPYGLAV